MRLNSCNQEMKMWILNPFKNQRPLLLLLLLSTLVKATAFTLKEQQAFPTLAGGGWNDFFWGRQSMHKALENFVCFHFFPHLCPLPSSCRHPQPCPRRPSGGGGQHRGLLKPAGSLCPAAATGWFQGDLLGLPTKEQRAELKQHLFKITCH